MGFWEWWFEEFAAFVSGFVPVFFLGEVFEEDRGLVLGGFVEEGPVVEGVAVGDTGAGTSEGLKIA